MKSVLLTKPSSSPPPKKKIKSSRVCRYAAASFYVCIFVKTAFCKLSCITVEFQQRGQCLLLKHDEKSSYSVLTHMYRQVEKNISLWKIRIFFVEFCIEREVETELNTNY